MKEYFKKHKIALIVLAAALALILVSSFCAAMVQTDAFQVKVTELLDEEFENEKVTNKFGDELYLKGTVASGTLFVPNKASKDHKLPAVVLTHGYLNNKELQLQNAIELARRGFVVLAIDRGGHGNNEISQAASAMMNTSGMYEAVQYLACQEYVDVAKIGISGHSMGGFTTSMTLVTDMYLPIAGIGVKTDEKTGVAISNLGLVSAGLMQGWDSYYASGLGVSVGMLKAMDDEFFFGTKSASGGTTSFPDGSDSICREFLHTTTAAAFVGVTGYSEAKDSINIENGGIYVDGEVVKVEGGKASVAPFRVIYEANEIHPLNHFSVESAGYVTNFFYTAFGTPNGYEYIAEGSQTWVVKELFSTLGLVGFFAMILPIVDLLLSVPFFATLRRKEAAEGATGEMLPELKGVRRHISYWVVGVLTTLFSGFAIQWVYSGDGWLHGFCDLITTRSSLFPQDTTGTVASWAVVCGLFALLLTGIVWLVNYIIDKVQNNPEKAMNSHPLAAARIEGGLGAFLKTVLLGAVTVALIYLVVFINWAIWTVDFRFWTFDIQPFEVATMLPTMLRYACVFFIFYAINSILNQGYRTKNLPEWATIAINAAFNILGIVLVIAIQYGTFRSTGVLWQSDMALGYIVLFPIIPVLIIATILSRRLYVRTGNAWLGAVINSLLFTIMTVANTATSIPYVGFFA